MICTACGKEYPDFSEYCPFCGKDRPGSACVPSASVSFGRWDPSVHQSDKQKRKIKDAQKSTCTPSAVDEENQKAVFLGSKGGEYSTTLKSCSCPGYKQKNPEALPCKHIYRLAMELKLIDIEPEYGINKNVFKEDAPTLVMSWDACVCMHGFLSSRQNGSDEIIPLRRSEYNDIIEEVCRTGFCCKVHPDSDDDVCELVVSDAFKPYIVAFSRKVAGYIKDYTDFNVFDPRLDPNHPDPLSFRFKSK